ncbi:hypothetical protein [Alkaliphilus peptidifermentans]|uniref:Uncharacterized protein n=1 Tax=Alkaliphilus peptidifermentans DSM 18978 TaxID=1120976 RepID=A0A1G5L6U3_9FIRM|nr:hypothetical protein [Alkaliphilus peptidifermentans]SCZ08304.1 hypothetical protein SAMN03080606_04105 [Alkaliphilus peptidifermentans DSM 18978]
MNEFSNISIIKDFEESYKQGYRCVYYETDEANNYFNVYLKNFETEKVKTIQSTIEDGEVFKQYIRSIT